MRRGYFATRSVRDHLLRTFSQRLSTSPSVSGLQSMSSDIQRSRLKAMFDVGRGTDMWRNLIRASEAGEGGGEGVNPLNPEIHVL
jgi:hypothetical protein